jgi:hypothetical protein
LKITTDATGYERGVGRVGQLAKGLEKEFAALGKKVSDVGADLTKWVSGPILAVGAGVGALVVGMEKLFGDPLKVPIQFETPWGTWDSGDGLLAGLSRTLTGAGSDRPIALRVNLDGRQIARNQTTHFGEALEQAGYA